MKNVMADNAIRLSLVYQEKQICFIHKYFKIVNDEVITESSVHLVTATPYSIKVKNNPSVDHSSLKITFMRFSESVKLLLPFNSNYEIHEKINILNGIMSIPGNTEYRIVDALIE
ncbi:MAG: hypothetical protein ABIH86_04470, partial [Planctomycetota bacterium]